MTRKVVGGVVAVVLTAGTVALSQIPYGEVAADGIVRLAWRSAPAVVRVCRALTEEEIADTPAHMRQAEICEGSGIPYRVRLAVDGEWVIDERVIGAGRLSDRPLFVLAEVRRPPGVYELDVRFRPDTALAAADTFPRLSLVDTVRLGAGDIALVTRLEDGGNVLSVVR